ncbi:zinc ABC transporter substrate-binding protein [Luteolibacter ambystomatis]|uniref:Zinc ABC transporter substrate-binding protein n=1 Tax=Luteolibacter ambystomatis TaxID=2824561 RepID=A0A975J273_9BACT|nr:metal ABC transporter substrate-binding protein [Luteolibacter ambystomatis]QUE52666.1 zinc ABC transporter substrate-binding protein [Luteolibacter ambystomatis]
MFRPLLLIFSFLFSGMAVARMKVATFYPLLTDLVRQVGGDRVEVVDLISTSGDPHHFEPSPEDLRKATGARLYLVAGLGLEAYLPSLQTIVPSTSRLVEVGASLPVLHGSCDEADHNHSDHETDPHWWHSIDRFRRATTVVAEALATADPEGASFYRTNAATYREKLDELERWTRSQVARIPRDRRQLATTHSAFNYFCADYGFTPFSVQGLNQEQDPSAATLAKLVADLKQHRVSALFPEVETNPKLLSVLTRDTGIRLGKPLIADGTNSPTYESMVRHNVSVIVEALAAK